MLENKKIVRYEFMYNTGVDHEDFGEGVRSDTIQGLIMSFVSIGNDEVQDVNALEHLILNSTFNGSTRFVHPNLPPLDVVINSFKIDQDYQEGFKFTLELEKTTPSRAIQVTQSDAEAQYDSTVFDSEEEYIIQDGDTLYNIAVNTMGDGLLWSKIWDYNIDTIKDPDLIFPGQRIKIPT